MGGLRRRTRVLIPGLAIASAAVLFFDGMISLQPDLTWGMRAVFLFGPYAGPFVGWFGPVIGFEAGDPWFMLLAALPLLALIVSHPLYPHRLTGLLSAVGLFLWFLFGLSFIHQASA